MTHLKLKPLINEDIFKTDLKLKTHEKLIANAVTEFMTTQFNFKAKIIVKKKDNNALIGDISLTNASVNNNKFTVHYNPNQSYRGIIKSLIHELTHVKQVTKKELQPNKEWNAIVWKGKDFISVRDYNKLMKKGFSEYKKLPWEEEAYSNMDKLYSVFTSSNYWTGLKGKDETLDYIIKNV